MHTVPVRWATPTTSMEPEWNNKSTQVDIIAGHGLDNSFNWITYFIPTVKRRCDQSPRLASFAK